MTLKTARGFDSDVPSDNPETRVATPAMDRPDDTLFPVEPLQELVDLGEDAVRQIEFRPVSGPLIADRVDYDKVQKWHFGLIVAMFEREAAKKGFKEAWRVKRDEALALGREYLEREELTMPEEFDYGLTRSEAQKYRFIWDAITDCLDHPAAMTKAVGEDIKAVGLSVRVKRYQVINEFCSTLLSKHLDSLLDAGFNVPALPKYGKRGCSLSTREWYDTNDYEILGACFRRDVELFVCYLTRFERYTEEQAEALRTIERERDLPPHQGNSRRSRRSSARHEDRNRSGRSNRILEDLQEEDEIPEEDNTSRRPPRTPSVRSGRSGHSSRQENQELPRRGRRYTELFGPGGIPPPPPPPRARQRNAPGGDPSDDSSSDSDSGNSRAGGNRPIPPPIPPPRQPRPHHRNRPQSSNSDSDEDREVSRFDLKLKTDVVPTWDGNTDSLARWLQKVNLLAKRSRVIFRQLGSVVPQRFRGNAENWFYSLPEDTRENIQSNWNTLKEAVRAHYMNRHWLDRQKAKANKAKYREAGYSRESPSEYYIRKLELLEFVYDYSDAELITEIMSGAPVIWNTILNPHQFRRVTDLQNTIKYYEETLSQLSDPREHTPRETQYRPFKPRDREVRSNLAKAPLGTPKFPKDDSTVSKRKTPEELGVRPCRHCGSGKHWDNECKYSRKGQRLARTNFIEQSPEEEAAQDAYDEIYLGLDSDDEEELHQGSTEDQQDFREPLQTTCASVHFTQPSEEILEEDTDLKGDPDSTESPGATEVEAHTSLVKYQNRASRRKSARQFRAHTRRIAVNSESKSNIYTMTKFLARPPGTSFLGAKATKARAHIGSLEEAEEDIIIDSGSDITLISKKCWESLTTAPKLKAGQKINLIQVTGSAKINGYVNIDLYFPTDDGYVQLEVEAYVVKGMSTPFILGNDFQDQYMLSILREGGNTEVLFGNSGKRIAVENSTSPSLMDDGGHAFNVLRSPKSKASKPRRLLKSRKRDSSVRASRLAIIPPYSSKLIPVTAHFPDNCTTLLVEKQLLTNKNPEDVFAAADTFISKEASALHVANFSAIPVVIPEGQFLGTSHNPKTWLSSAKDLSNSELRQAAAQAAFIRELAATETAKSITEELITARGKSKIEDPAATEPLDGGPKTAEVPPEDIDESMLLKEIGFSEHLTTSQKSALEEVVARNKLAFSLNGRLGHYDARVEITLKDGVKPVSIPPFPCSPANREVMDKQMDTWLQQGVIEPSQSPWAAPVFITWRNGKPRMVIDLRRLNESVIPDEFPIPRQEEILQALEGSQWLSTLDALSGFTQLEIADKDKEKLAFRTHRGLFHFRRMPFGYRNGPSVFQRIMQTVLAPFLWLFALVYIDDIVVYSKTFEDHIKHLDMVFSAMKKAKLTLSPNKCHLGYQSVLLLGQKVSRLGMSTHKEKVDAIVALEEPRNVKELQTFLGMMVYFSSYIPFYAWIAAPLFELLKKDGKGWYWTDRQQEAFELCKEVLINAPVRAFAMPGRPYRIYSDACDYGLAAILQQVQPIQVKDLRGTKIYDRLKKAYDKKEPVPNLVTAIPGEDSELPKEIPWAKDFEDTTVYIERVVAYWSRILRAAERNYSPTEREALALKEGLIKFQSYLEGAKVTAITDHAALTWTRTFQNVNKRLLTWGAVFSAYPGLRIVHRAGRVHSNVDPISRLRRRVPFQEGPTLDPTKPIHLANGSEDPLKNMYEELGERFEERLLRVASKHAISIIDEDSTTSSAISINNTEAITEDYSTSAYHSIVIGFSDKEYEKWKTAYKKDKHFQEVLKAMSETKDWAKPLFPQYYVRDDGLLMFEDGTTNSRLCVPEELRLEIMKDIHDGVTESAHAGYHRCYNRIAGTYYWPRMSRDIKRYVSTCDICQKAKPRRHAPVGLLRPIPIPTRPFEVISMDFIPELPLSDGYDNVLVIVDKLTKYGIFIPCHTSITEKETAQLVFKHIICEYGIPRQIISDRDVRWRGDFWKETCRLLGTERALTTSYHPQADGQTEVLNQGLEIALRAYVGPTRDDWVGLLPALALSYNTSPHSSTGFQPAFLLRGYLPTTSSTFITDPGQDPRSKDNLDSLHPDATHLVSELQAARSEARDALILAQAHQQRAYNQGRLIREFEVGEKVVLNVDSLELLRAVKGRGRKLLMKYEGPFEIIRKLSPVSYQIRLPASYGMHPILNIAHLEKYEESPSEFGSRPKKSLEREDFDLMEEFEVERIIEESTRKGRNGKRIPIFKTRFVGYGSEDDEWLTKTQLRNAPEKMQEWEKEKRRRRVNRQ